MVKEIKFNIPKDHEDERRLLIDLENNIGVILRKENGFFVVVKYGGYDGLFKRIIKLLNIKF